MAKQINIGKGSLCLQLCKNDKQLAPNMPYWFFALTTVKAQARQRNNLHKMLKQTFRNVALWRKVQAIMLDKRHCVLIQLEQNLILIFLYHNVANNVSNIVYSCRMQQMIIFYVYFL